MITNIALDRLEECRKTFDRIRQRLVAGCKLVADSRLHVTALDHADDFATSDQWRAERNQLHQPMFRCRVVRVLHGPLP